MKIRLLFAVLVLNFLQNADAQQLSNREIVLIKEAFNVQREVGHLIWPSWSPSLAPLLYITESYQYLINHPNPPSEYQRCSFELFSSPVFFTRSTSNEQIQAAYPIGEVSTIVMSAPTEDTPILLWIMKFQHEHFHIYQDRSIDGSLQSRLNFRTSNVETNELNYSFQFDADALMSLINEEGRSVFKLIKENLADRNSYKEDLIELEKKMGLVTNGSADLSYKKWMEWKEGVARYTEYQFSNLVLNNTIYEPDAEFIHEFNLTSYEGISQYYSEGVVTNPIKFVGKGVQGTVLFYYLGLGKALLLDKYFPDWKSEYFHYSLDDMLIKALSQ